MMFTRQDLEKTFVAGVAGMTAVIGGAQQAAAAPPQTAAGQNSLSVAVTRNQIQATSDGIQINNAELARAITTDRAATVEFLAKRFPGLTSSQISISKSGAVLIANNSVKRDLGKAMSGNGVCGNVKCGAATLPGSAIPKTRSK